MFFSEVVKILESDKYRIDADEEITRAVIDTRSAQVFRNAVFFALKTDKRDGHRYIADASKKGIKNFVVQNENFLDSDNTLNYCVVDNTLEALQKLATKIRTDSHIPLISITGSNGKTIVKEWLSQILANSFKVVKSPKSFNSQIGVPLSVWQINDRHNLGIFEAGISQKGEMQKLHTILKPEYGILTNIGSAHDEGFANRDEKLEEKLRLFVGCEKLILRDIEFDRIKSLKKDFGIKKYVVWGNFDEADYCVELHRHNSGIISIGDYEFQIHFSDKANIENICHCIIMALELGVEPGIIQEKLHQLPKLNMRLEVKEAENDCVLIDDTYNHDEAGLRVAVEYLAGQYQGMAKSVIISELPQSGLSMPEQIDVFNRILSDVSLKRRILIGKEFAQFESTEKGQFEIYESVEDFLQNLPDFSSELILLKGSRSLHFERIARKLEKKIHGTRLEINLSSLAHNLNYFRSRLSPSTKLMVMVKAFAYGAGSREVANLLEYNQIDYLGVAYASEGVELRKLGLTLPIFVMNPSEESLSDCFEYNLEPEIYSFRSLRNFLKESESRDPGISVHINIDTGMKRLGFEEDQIEELADILVNSNINIASIFSHLASSDDLKQSDFTLNQIDQFNKAYDHICNKIGHKPLKHILNSAGILNFPDYHFDMVRLGIGLYGVNNAGLKVNPLMPIGRLVSEISQIKEIGKGETVGYSRKGSLPDGGKIATIPIGYADGFSRIFSNGTGKVAIKGQLVPVIGNVCMDMIMVNVSGLEVNEGDEVVIFGDNPSVEDLAEWSETIPYEILTNIGERVKRIYITD